MTPRPVVLCLDDEPNVLSGLKRSLRGRFDVMVTTDQQEALDLLTDEQNGIAVFISDLRMPGMDGVAVLERAKKVAPLTTRVLLTGDTDLHSALAAVNRGSVFRIILKPCPAEDLQTVVDAAVEQYRLHTGERELLEATLKGCVDALMDTLGMAQPVQFSRAGRLRRLVGDLCRRLDVTNGWQVEIAAQMGDIGAVTLTPLAMAIVERGTSDTSVEAAMLAKLQHLADDVLARIPRLEAVRDIVRCQRPTNRPAMDQLAPDAPEGARILQAAREYDVLIQRGAPALQAVHALSLRATHSPDVLAALAALAREATATVPADAEPAGPSALAAAVAGI